MSLAPLVEPWTLAFPYTRSTGATLGRFFAGLAERLYISPRTADTWWAYARAWLSIELDESEKPPSDPSEQH